MEKQGKTESNNNKQISFRVSDKLLRLFKEKLKRESKSLTLFFQNTIKEYLEKKP